MFRATVLAAAIAALPGAAHAAGLGKITVLSALGQPLRAEVELSASREELSSLKAQIAPAEAFRQAGIEYSPALAGVRVSVEKRSNGQPYLKLTSDRPVNDPFLDLLLEVNWAQGRLQREYTFLLDPPAEALTPAPIAVTPGARREATAVARPVAPQAQPQARATAPADGKPLAKGSEKPAAAVGEHEVKKGETLHKIASETQYEGISLDQMLVAIFRNNRDAFIGDNMNRLKAGKILSIPERQEVEAIEPADAQRIVRAQSADFNAYRRRLAEAAAAAEPAKEAAAQQAASGKISAKIEDKVPAPAETQDQLKVSRSEAGKEAQALQGKLAALEEETVAKEKALKEATSRLAELEKNVKELQKLLELKNQNLAELQKQAAAGAAAGAAATAAKPEVPAPAAPAPKAEEVKPAPAAEKPAEPAPAAEPSASVAAAPAPAPQAAVPAAEKPTEAPKPVEQNAQPPKKPAAPPPPPREEPGFFDGLMENPLVLAGGAAILGLLGLLGWRQRQKGKQEQAEPVPTTSVNLATNSVFGSTGGQSVDTSVSSLQTDFSQASISAIDADEGVDPVAEADVYMAYGRDAQAEEILLDALKNDPSRTAIHVKLLEIYAGRKNMKQFETLAGELYAQTGGVGADWEKVATMGLKLDPGNPLYGGKAAEEGAPAPQAAAADATIIVSSPEKLKDTWTMPGELSQIASAVESPGAAPTVVLDKAEAAAAEELAPALDFDLDLGEPAAKPEAAPAAEAPRALDFDLGLDFPAAPKQEAAPALATEAPLDLDFKLPDLPEAVGGGDSGLHFDLDLSPAPAASGAETTLPTGSAVDFQFDLGEPAAPTPAPVDLSSIDLNLEQAQAVLEMPELGPEDEQEVATKLELAKAYEEMGDREGARELLQEVVKEGDAEQQRRARDMLAALV